MTATAAVPVTEQTIRTRIDDLVAWFREGRLPEAIAAFYTEDVVMRENLNPPTIGRAANVARERAFRDSIRTWHEIAVSEVLVDGNRAVVHWILDYTTTDGKHVRLDELALQRWDGDRIAEERFVYDPTASAA